MDSGFHSWYNRYYRSVYSVAVYYVGDYTRAEDLTHDLFLHLYEQRSRYSENFDMKNYLLKSIKNRCLNDLKKSQREVCGSQLTDVEDESCELVELKIKEVTRILNELPPKRKEVVLLYFQEGKSYTEIAQILDISLNTVKDHLKKAYSVFRKEFDLSTYDSILLLSIILKYVKK